MRPLCQAEAAQHRGHGRRSCDSNSPWGRLSVSPTRAASFRVLLQACRAARSVRWSSYLAPVSSSVVAQPTEIDVAVLEVLGAAPSGEVPVGKLEALAVLLHARGLLQCGAALNVQPPNGHPPSAPSIHEMADRAVKRRAAIRTDDGYRLTRGAGLLLTSRGLLATDEVREVLASFLDKPVDKILEAATDDWPAQ